MAQQVVRASRRAGWIEAVESDGRLKWQVPYWSVQYIWRRAIGADEVDARDETTGIKIVDDGGWVSTNASVETVSAALKMAQVESRRDTLEWQVVQANAKRGQISAADILRAAGS